MKYYYMIIKLYPSGIVCQPAVSSYCFIGQVWESSCELSSDNSFVVQWCQNSGHNGNNSVINPYSRSLDNQIKLQSCFLFSDFNSSSYFLPCAAIHLDKILGLPAKSSQHYYKIVISSGREHRTRQIYSFNIRSPNEFISSPRISWSFSNIHYFYNLLVVFFVLSILFLADGRETETVK